MAARETLRASFERARARGRYFDDFGRACEQAYRDLTGKDLPAHS